MNIRNLRFPLAALALFSLVSCNVQESSTEPSRVALAPRFAAGTTVPSTVCVSVRFQTESGIDSTQTEPYVPGGTINLGTLPPSTPFKMTMTGYDTTHTGDTVAIWWTTKLGTSGNDATQTIVLPTPQQCSTPSVLIPSSDTVFYQGKFLKFPAGTRITNDSTDPRTNKTTVMIVDSSATYLADSVPLLRAAVMIPANNATGSPALWSLVKDFHLQIDPVDIEVRLDSLILSTWSEWEDSLKDNIDSTLAHPVHADSVNESAISQAPFHPDDSSRVDTLNGTIDDDVLSLHLHCYVVPLSRSATVRIGTQPIPRDSFVRIPFPTDSIVEVVVENNGRSRTYSVHLTRPPQVVSIPTRLDSLKSPSPGLAKDPTNNAKYTIELPAGQDSLVLQLFPSAGCSARIAGRILTSGNTISLYTGLDTATFQIEIFADPTDVTPGVYLIRVSHTLPIAFRDTSYGVPWRDVDYDTLVFNSRKYRTVEVGSARWMAENLNFKVDSSFCSSPTVDICAKYARHYTWSGAADTTAHFDSAGLTFTGNLQGVCPVGWHLPSLAEWQTMISLLGTERSATLLRSYGNSWPLGGGLDSLGMRILPAGRRTLTVSSPYYQVVGLNSEAWFWTSTQGPSQNQANAIKFTSVAGQINSMPGHPKAEALSVRCVSDTAVVAP